jgi:transposase InsO family protein
MTPSSIENEIAHLTVAAFSSHLSRLRREERLVMTAYLCAVTLAIENIDHTRTKVKNPQTKGIVERFHKTMLNEFYRITFRKKIYTTLIELQRDLDLWVREYNEVRVHQGRWCYGRTPGECSPLN